jgi:hypothetical protein
MPVVVFDDFNRPDNPTSLGTATTGQTWSVVSGDFPFGILSNQGYWNRTGSGDAGIDGIAVVESGLSNLKASVRLMNISAGGGLNLRNQGLVIRYVDSTHFLMLVYFNASGSTGFRCYVADGGAATARANGADGLVLVDGDTIAFAACDQVLKCYLNGVLEATTDFTLGGNGPLLSPTLLAGTKCGVQASGGIISDDDYQIYEDFTVETNLECEAALWTLPPLEWTAEVTVVNPVPPSSGTFRFDAGNGVQYYMVPSVSDSGNELRSKTYKAMRATGRFHNASMMGFGYDVGQPIVTEDLEEGNRSNTRMITRPQAIADSDEVSQSKRLPINVSNAVLGTVRLEGDDRGETQRDEVHEIVVEEAIEGVRR